MPYVRSSQDNTCPRPSQLPCQRKPQGYEERARRRHKELTEKGYDIDMEKMKADIAARDKADSEREISPLVQAEDATLLDTTGLSIDEVVERILAMCR